MCKNEISCTDEHNRGVPKVILKSERRKKKVQKRRESAKDEIRKPRIHNLLI